MFLGHWQFFKSFFNIVFLRYLLGWFALVPIIIKLSSSLPEQLYLPGTNYYLNLSLPFSWWLLWLASLCYFVAFVLFHLFCPQFIKRYPSFTDYQTFGHSPRWIIWEFYYAVQPPRPKNLFLLVWRTIFLLFSPVTQTDKLFERVIIKEYAKKTLLSALPHENPVVEKNETAAYFSYKGSIYRISRNPDDANIVITEREIFWEVLGHFAKQAPFLRGVISFLIGLTLVLVVYVLLQHIRSGISLMVQ